VRAQPTLPRWPVCVSYTCKEVLLPQLGRRCIIWWWNPGQRPDPLPAHKGLPCPLALLLQFEHQCRPFLVSGFNVDNIAQAPLVAASPRQLQQGSSTDGRDRVQQLLLAAAAAGLNVMRTWAHTTDPNIPLQVLMQSWQAVGLCSELVPALLLASSCGA
jgi:hypothetical protein